MTVHVDVPGVITDAGLQVKPLTSSGGALPTVIVPPLAVKEITVPAGEAPMVLVTEMDVLVVTVAERVTLTVATTPLLITFELTPETRHK